VDVEFACSCQDFRGRDVRWMVSSRRFVTRELVEGVSSCPGGSPCPVPLSRSVWKQPMDSQLHRVARVRRLLDRGNRTVVVVSSSGVGCFLAHRAAATGGARPHTWACRARALPLAPLGRLLHA
jgi:hypothetical protein